MDFVLRLGMLSAGALAIGAVVYGMSRLFRCELAGSFLSQPRRSSWRAVIAAGVSCVGMAVLLWLMYPWAKPQGIEGIRWLDWRIHVLNVAGLLVWILPAGAVMIWRKERLASVGITTRNLWQSIVIGLVLTLPTFYLHPGGLVKLFRIEAYHGVAFAYFAVVALSEEFVFRGFLQTRLIAWLGRTQGWLLAGFIFAYTHVISQMITKGCWGWDAIAGSTILVPVGLLLGFIMLRTRSLIAPVILHTFINWTGTLK